MNYFQSSSGNPPKNSFRNSSRHFPVNSSAYSFEKFSETLAQDLLEVHRRMLPKVPSGTVAKAPPRILLDVSKENLPEISLEILTEVHPGYCSGSAFKNNPKFAEIIIPALLLKIVRKTFLNYFKMSSENSPKD